MENKNYLEEIVGEEKQKSVEQSIPLREFLAHLKPNLTRLIGLDNSFTINSLLKALVDDTALEDPEFRKSAKRFYESLISSKEIREFLEAYTFFVSRKENSIPTLIREKEFNIERRSGRKSYK